MFPRTRATWPRSPVELVAPGARIGDGRRRAAMAAMVDEPRRAPSARIGDGRRRASGERSDASVWARGLQLGAAEVPMKIACILSDGYEDSEFKVPYDKLQAAGHQVTVIGATKGETLKGKAGKVSVDTDASIDDVGPSSFDALLIPGGHSPDQLRADDRFVAFTRAFADKPIFAVCHGPQLLITADMVKGRTMTAWKTIQLDLKNAGATVVDKEVVVDKNLVTSRKPDDLDAFVRESLRLLSNGKSVHA